MDGIDVSKIMEEVRASIPEREEDWQRLRFEDIPIDASAGTVESGEGSFDREEFDRAAVQVSESWNAPFFRDIPGGRVKVFFKRVVRKLIRFCLEPITQDVTGFQHAVARCMAGLRRFMGEQLGAERRHEAEIAALQTRVEELEARLEELEKK